MSSLDRVRGEFARHNLPLQALLGLLGYGERAARLAEGLRTEGATLASASRAPETSSSTSSPPPGTHALDLALLGLLGLRERMLAELALRDLVPASEARPHTEALASDPSADTPPPLRQLAR